MEEKVADGDGNWDGGNELGGGWEKKGKEDVAEDVDGM